MAYIQKVKRKQDTAYRVFILVDKEKRITKTFSTKRSAVQFVNSVESDRNKLLAYTQSKSRTLLLLQNKSPQPSKRIQILSSDQNRFIIA